MKWKFRYKSSKGFKFIKLGFYKRFRFTTLWFLRQIELQYYDTKDWLLFYRSEYTTMAYS